MIVSGANLEVLHEMVYRALSDLHNDYAQGPYTAEEGIEYEETRAKYKKLVHRIKTSLEAEQAKKQLGRI